MNSFETAQIFIQLYLPNTYVTFCIMFTSTWCSEKRWRQWRSRNDVRNNLSLPMFLIVSTDWIWPPSSRNCANNIKIIQKSDDGCFFFKDDCADYVNERLYKSCAGVSNTKIKTCWKVSSGNLMNLRKISFVKSTRLCQDTLRFRD